MLFVVSENINSSLSITTTPDPSMQIMLSIYLNSSTCKYLNSFVSKNSFELSTQNEVSQANCNNF